MKLIGFDQESGKIRNTNGRIALIDQEDNETASWSFLLCYCIGIESTIKLVMFHLFQTQVETENTSMAII